MKQIYCGLLGIFLLLDACAPQQGKLEESGSQRVYRITQSDPFGKISSEIWTVSRFQTFGIKKMSSSYFDRAMKYRETEFEAVSLLKIISQFNLKKGEDAVLLNCFDDYQGVLPISDILRYDLYLATKIKVRQGSSKPGWLNPLLVIVPDAKQPLFEERFLTANIRELKFIRSSDYYSPLKKFSRASKEAGRGFEVYKNNCLFCHSLKGRGGNKGARLLKKYSMSQGMDNVKFETDFKSFHNKNNADKQDVEQFVTEDKLKSVIGFLWAIQKADEN